MKACVYSENMKIELQEVEKPELKDDNIIVKVLATSICGTDIRAYKFGSSRIIPPRIIGHELIGEICEIGSKVKEFELGDIIQVAPAIGCQNCSLCSEGRTNICDNMKTIGFQYDGTFAEFMAIPALAIESGNVNNLGKSINLPAKELTLAEPIACVINAQEYLKITEGSTVAVLGAGFIGCMHAELALLQGAKQVYMIEPNDIRRASGKNLLPDIEWLENTADSEAEIMKATGGIGVDVVIVACSVGSAQITAMNIAAKFGRISLFGGLPGESLGFIDSNLIHYREISVYGVHASTPAQNKKALSYITSGKLKLTKYIQKTYTLDKIMQAFEDSVEGNVMKAIILP